MPSASDELRAKMKEYFGDEVSDEGPINYLKEQGYTLRRDYQWEKEGITNYGKMSQKEYECLLFLVREWDFDGLYGGA